MALFGKKQKDDTDTQKAEAVSKETVKTPVAPRIHADRDLSSVITKPRITEKAALQIDKNVYTFEVRKNATKYDVRDAVKELYNVTPLRVNIVNKTPRHFMSRSRGRNLMEKGLRKAYVQLKEGDRIDLA